MDIFIGEICISVKCEIEEINQEIKDCFYNNVTLLKSKYKYVLSIHKRENRSITVILNDINGIEVYHDTFDRSRFIDIFTNQIIANLIHQCQVISFHASSFWLKGHLFVILGGSGSGKTTFVLKCLKDYGASYFSDDFTIFDLNHHAFVPFSRMFHVRKNTERLLEIPENKKESYFKDALDSYKLYSPYELGIPICNNKVSLSDVCFVKIKYSKGVNTGFMKLSPKESVMYLIENCSNITSIGTDMVHFYQKARSSEAKFYSLTYSDHKDAFEKLLKKLEAYDYV